jgi:hypothetical protein
MRHWVEALLHPEPIEKGSKDKQNLRIQMPPKFDLNNAKPVILPPHSSVRTTRARSTRSASPTKMATPRKIATPRKSRTTRGSSRAADAIRAEEILGTPAKAAQPTSPLLNVDSAVQESPVNGEAAANNVHIEVKETVEEIGDAQTTTTNVQIDIPPNYPELRQPEDPTKMIEEAKRMVAEARELEGASSSATKRKVDEIIDEAELALQRPTKATKVYTTEQKLTKEKVTRRALVGLTVMAAIGYVKDSLFCLRKQGKHLLTPHCSSALQFFA